MGPMQVVFSGLVTIIVYGVILFGVYKLFQIGSDVSEIKELLREIRRNTENVSPLVTPPAHSESYADSPSSRS